MVVNKLQSFKMCSVWKMCKLCELMSRHTVTVEYNNHNFNMTGFTQDYITFNDLISSKNAKITVIAPLGDLIFFEK